MQDKRARMKRLSYSRKTSIELDNCQPQSDTLLFISPPKISPRWVIERTSMLQLDTKYGSCINELRAELINLHTNELTKKSYWKDIINDDLISDSYKINLANFRAKIFQILSDICEKESLHETHCVVCGSNKMDSDLDISLAGCRFFTNVKALMTINGFIDKINIFESQACFYSFFDMHFYLSNFGIIRNDKYIISTDYNKQLSYAFMKHREFNKEAYFDLAFGIAQNMHASENMLIDLLSQLSLYENDSYKTQGAFFHVVLLLQQGRENLPITDEMFMISCIENLCFANMHEDRRDKYISRALDALERIQNTSFCTYTKKT